MTIHFWDTKKVASDLALDQITERDGFAYFVANSVLWTIAFYYGVLFGARLDWLFLYELIVVLAITVFGLFRCFEANGSSGGRQFVLRATCLSFPIGVKINLLSSILGWASYFYFPSIVDGVTFRDPTRVYYLITFFWAATFAALFYWRLWYHLSSITQRHLTRRSTQTRHKAPRRLA